MLVANAVSALHGFARPGFDLALNHSGKWLEIEFQYGQLLVDVVVQLAGDAGALRFLRRRQLSSQFHGYERSSRAAPTLPADASCDARGVL